MERGEADFSGHCSLILRTSSVRCMQANIIAGLRLQHILWEESVVWWHRLFLQSFEMQRPAKVHSKPFQMPGEVRHTVPLPAGSEIEHLAVFLLTMYEINLWGGTKYKSQIWWFHLTFEYALFPHVCFHSSGNAFAFMAEIKYP